MKTTKASNALTTTTATKLLKPYILYVTKSQIYIIHLYISYYQLYVIYRLFRLFILYNLCYIDIIY